MKRKLPRSILAAALVAAVLPFNPTARADWESNYLQHLGSTGYAFVSVMAPSNASGSQAATINFKHVDTVVQSTTVTLAPGQVFALRSTDFDMALTGWEGIVQVQCDSCMPWASMVFVGSDTTGLPTNFAGAPTGGSGGVPTSDCSASPLTGCDTAEVSSLVIKNKTDDNKDKLASKFAKGSTPREGGEFADPTSETTYNVCLYANGTRVGQAKIGPDAAKWNAVGTDKGFKYTDKTGAHDGVNKVLLKAGKTGEAKPPQVLVKGKGVGLPDVALPLTAPVRLQVVNTGSGLCLEGLWSETQILKNDPEKGLFKAHY